MTLETKVKVNKMSYYMYAVFNAGDVSHIVTSLFSHETSNQINIVLI